MADSITASAILHGPLLGARSIGYGRGKRRLSVEILGRRQPAAIRAVAEELTREAPRVGDLQLAVPRLWPPPNRADNPALHNPLLRQERLGCGWISAIFELEGVIVEDDPEIERQSWIDLAREEGRSPPPAVDLRRIEGMKHEQAISEVLCWSRDPNGYRRLASRKEEIHRALQGGAYCLRPGSVEFMNTLRSHKIPIAVMSTRPRAYLEEALAAVGIQGSFDAVVTAEDVHRAKPDPEMLEYAEHLLNFIPERCIVFGNSNSTIEAARHARMRCVAVASKHPVYELGAADHVVRQLTELSIIDLKNLVAVESAEFELEMELEDEPEPSTRATAVRDIFS